MASLQKLAPSWHTPQLRTLAATAMALALALAGVADSADAKRPRRAPNTTITSGPAAGSTTADPTPTFGFAASVSGSTFQCRVDSASFAGCASPTTTATLSDGVHTFSVRAADPTGLIDSSPASVTFTVEESPPGEESVPPPEPSPAPTTWRRSTSFESSLTEGTDGWSIGSPFQVARTGEAGGAEGLYASKIVTNGGNAGCSCPRMKFEDGFSYGPGRDVWMSGSWKIPDPTRLAWSRLMNLGHYEGVSGEDWYLALESTSAGTFQVSHSPYGDSKVVVLPARPIPANTWFRVDLHFVLSPVDGQALTEWYIDGQLVGTSTRANMRNSEPLHFFNAGLSYFWPGNGNATVYFDAPRLAG